MVPGDRQPGRVELERGALHPNVHPGETEDLESAGLPPAHGINQQLGLERHPLPDRNVVAIHRRRQEGGTRH
jgi:hypothetical protein